MTTKTKVADSGKRTAAHIAAELEAQRVAQSEAEAEIARLAAARPAMLLTVSDDELEAHDRSAAKAGRAVERAVAMQAKLGPELKEARTSEEQDRRRAIYDKGVAAAAEYKRLVKKDYAPAARKVADALAAMRAQAQAVEAANNELPEGAARIDPDAFRHPVYDPGTPPPEFINETFWVDEDGHRARPIVANGVLQTRGLTQKTGSTRNPAYLTWRRPERQYSESILASVALPAVMPGEAPLWLGQKLIPKPGRFQ